MTVRYKTAALARHIYIMSRFQSFPIPNSTNVEWRFVGNLPRARTVQEAINAAIIADGMPIPQGPGVEISEQTAKQVKFLIDNFVAAAPETVVADDGDNRFTDVHYSYGFAKAFRTKPTSTFQMYLDHNCRYEPPAPIIGLRAGRDGIYELVHVALRKLADSKITSAMWNALHVIDDSTRNWFCNIIVTALTAKEYTNIDEVIAAVKLGFHGNEHAFGKPARMMLISMFELFDDNDWAGFLGYVVIWPGETE